MSHTIGIGHVCFKRDLGASRRSAYHRVIRTAGAVAALAAVVYVGLSGWLALWIWLAALSLLVGYITIELSRLLHARRTPEQSELVLGPETLAIHCAKGSRDCRYRDSEIEEVKTKNGAIESIVLKTRGSEKLKLAGFKEMNYIYRELKNRMRAAKVDDTSADSEG